MVQLIKVYKLVKDMFEVLPLDVNNRMLRAGFGKNEGKWFVRVDLWTHGVRITRT